jgi:hypothetical protein
MLLRTVAQDAEIRPQILFQHIRWQRNVVVSALEELHKYTRDAAEGFANEV